MLEILFYAASFQFGISNPDLIFYTLDISGKEGVGSRD